MCLGGEGGVLVARAERPHLLMGEGCCKRRGELGWYFKVGFFGGKVRCGGSVNCSDR